MFHTSRFRGLGAGAWKGLSESFHPYMPLNPDVREREKIIAMLVFQVV
jgi:hypothetical protein